MTSRGNQGSGEDRLIARFFKPIATHPGALGLGDDAAVIKPPAGCDLVWTTDALVEGVHFFSDDPADMVARKALRASLSDLAAKGARPYGFLLSLALPQGTADSWLDAFAKGLEADVDEFSCPLFGGDTVRTPGPLLINVAIIGSLPHGTMVTRMGAATGDRIMVSGTIGDAALGLKARRGQMLLASPTQRQRLIARYMLPQPRNAMAEAVRANASAAMDISDGLAGDLAKLCLASAVAARVKADLIPLSEAASAVLAGDPSLIETILAGGDDYEIVCTVPPSRAANFSAATRAAGVATTQVGTIEAGEGVIILDRFGRPLKLKQTSFSHF